MTIRLTDLLPEVIEAASRHLPEPRDRCAFAATCKRVRCILCSLGNTQRHALSIVGAPCLTCPIGRVHGITKSVPRGCYSCDLSLHYEIVMAARELAYQKYNFPMFSPDALAAMTERLRALTKRAAAMGYGQLAMRAARLYLRAFAWEATAHWLSTGTWYGDRLDMASLGAAAFFALDPLPPRFGARMPEGWDVDAHFEEGHAATSRLTCCASMLAPLLKLFRLSPRVPDYTMPRLPRRIEKYLATRGVVVDAQGGVTLIQSPSTFNIIKMPTPEESLLLLLPTDHVAHDSEGHLWSRLHADCLRDSIISRLPCPRTMRNAEYSRCNVLDAGNMRVVLALMHGDGCVDISLPVRCRAWLGASAVFDTIVTRGSDDDVRALFDTKGGLAVMRDYALVIRSIAGSSAAWPRVFPYWLRVAHCMIGLNTNTPLDRSAAVLWYAACELAVTAGDDFTDARLAGFATSQSHLLCDRPFEFLADDIIRALGRCYRDDLGDSITSVICKLARADILIIGDAIGLSRPRLLKNK